MLAQQRVALAVMVILGAVIYTPAQAQLINGSFEMFNADTGDITGFVRSGFFNISGGPTTGDPNFTTFQEAASAGSPKEDSNSVVTAQASSFDELGISGPPINPVDGQYLAFITNQTAAGNETLTGSSLSQTFQVPHCATSLTLKVRFLNNDHPDSFSLFNDFAGIALTQGETILGEYNIDLDPASPANAHVTAGASAGDFHNSTEWLTLSFDLSKRGGQVVTLTAYITNYGGDNLTESRLLIDDIRVVIQMADDVTSQVEITRGGLRRDHATGHYVQQVRLKNIGSDPIPATLSLVLDRLNARDKFGRPLRTPVRLVNATGRTHCIEPAGSPYVTLDPAPLAPGKTVTLILRFQFLPILDPGSDGGGIIRPEPPARIAYSTRVLAGLGAR